jgi:DNA-directed RNA polymerase specialized sigma24 family protein
MVAHNEYIYPMNQPAFMFSNVVPRALNTVRWEPKSIQNLDWLPHVGMGDDLKHESFEKFLNLLAPDREAAGFAYETLRRNLIFFFSMRRAPVPDELADETISIVARRVYEGINIQDVSRYALGVARNVLHVALRQESLLEYVENSTLDRFRAPSPTDELEETAALYSECLAKCLKQIESDDRDLFLNYYKKRKNVSGYRERLAARAGINLNILRIKVLRIRRKLQKCIIVCVEEKKPS